VPQRLAEDEEKTWASKARPVGLVKLARNVVTVLPSGDT